MKEGIFETLFIDIKFKQQSITCGTVYRAPNNDNFSQNQFFAHLSLLLKNIAKTKNKCYLTGDINVSLFNETNDFTSKFIDLMFDYSFTSLINKPTRITEKSVTIIDHI